MCEMRQPAAVAPQNEADDLGLLITKTLPECERVTRRLLGRLGVIATSRDREELQKLVDVLSDLNTRLGLK